VERNLEPFDLGTNVVVGIVGAHRPAENDGARVGDEGVRQRVAVARPADVHRNAAALEVMADAAGGRLLLVQHDQDGQCHGRT
jgi:hypothetical protein